MITSYFADRFPASSAFGKTTSNGNSNCSSSQRVQPEGIEPPYWSASAIRGFRNEIAVPDGRAPTASKLMPRSVASFVTRPDVEGRAVTKNAPGWGPVVNHATFSPAASRRLIATKASFVAWLKR